MRPARAFLTTSLGIALLLFVSACGSSPGPAAPQIGAAKTFHFAGFEPGSAVEAGHQTHLAFTIEQPSGKPLVDFRRGPGPHTGVHVIVVRDDLAVISHRHPPVAGGGRISEQLDLPPGRYRVVVDAYPNLSGPQRNFQLFHALTVKGAYQPTPLPPFTRTVTVDGYRFTLHGRPHLRAISPAFLTITVTGPDGKPAAFTPWYGALAHAIFFRKGSLDYFHTHVCSPGASGCTSILGATKVTGSSTTPGRLTVGVLVPVSGTWRLFLQTKVNGHVVTAPFTLEVS